MKLKNMARRAGWGLADQALSSLTNFAVGVVVARSVTPREFGAFGLAFATYLVMLGASRAVASEPLLVRFSATAASAWMRGTVGSTGAATVIGGVAGLACGAAGLIIGGTLGQGLIALAITLPGLLLQDAWRLAFFSADRGSEAFANDLVWAILLVPFFALAARAESWSVGWFMIAWGAGATGAALFGLWQARLRPGLSRAIGWWREHRDLAPRFLGEFIVRAGGSQLVFFGLGAVAGLAAVGSMRGAQIILGPFHVVFQGIWLVAIPEQVRLLKSTPLKLKKASMLFSSVLAAAAMLYGVAMLFLPDRVGAALIGASWGPAQDIVFPLALSFAGLGGVMGAASGLRSLGAAGRSLRARSIVSVLIVAGGVVGAAVAGALGAAIGLAVAYWLGAVVWWREFNSALAEHLAPQGGPPDDAAVVALGLVGGPER